MKIFVGTPINENKEYGIYRWLDNMKAQKWAGDISYFLADNSNTPAFSERVRAYAEGIGLQNVIVTHLTNMSAKEVELKRTDSREFFRNYFLTTDCDVWLSWECDIIVEEGGLAKIVPFLDYFDIIKCAYPMREFQAALCNGIGFALFKRTVMAGVSFSIGGGYGFCNPKFINCFYGNDSWFLAQAIDLGFTVVDLINVVSISHLEE
jgi:hypothetical protein